jgi:hypothetical protein
MSVSPPPKDNGRAVVPLFYFRPHLAVGLSP